MPLVDSFLPPDSPKNSVKHPGTEARRIHQPETSAVPKPKMSFVPPTRKRHGFRVAIEWILVLVVALALGLSLQSQVLGEIVLGFYLVVAVILGLSSKTSFGLALLAFVIVAVSEAIMPKSDIAANFAVYAFFLLLIGSILLILETRRQSKWDAFRRRRK
jgi:hypothetical protein